MISDRLGFDRCRHFMALCMACCVGMALHFAADIAAGRNTITPELYGPIVYAVPAQTWATAQAVFAGIAVTGLMIGGVGGALIAAIGAALTCALFMAFGWLASFASEGTLVVAVCRAVGVPVTFAILAAAVEKVWRDGRR